MEQASAVPEPIADAAPVAAASPPAPAEDAKPLSKNQQKKLAKAQKLVAMKAQRTAERKEKKKLKREANAERDYSSPKPKKQKIEQFPSSVRVVIDSDFADLMSEKEISSCMRQLTRCYAENRRAKTPVVLSACGVGKVMQDNLNMTQKDWRGWKMPIVETPLKEAIPDSSNVVYLTADSTTVLHELDETKAYVIGGIVDKNRYKNLCLNRANEAGLQTAQLPIGEYIKMNSRRVLTVNQVLEIMLKFLETKDWKEAFLQVIPQRKITPKVKKSKKGRKNQEGEEGQEEDEDEDGTDDGSEDDGEDEENGDDTEGVSDKNIKKDAENKEAPAAAKAVAEPELPK
ncbi:hypothetical protein CcCBS67573_g02542 [Chytriomyces confervae]|uniref:tRNA (guanine(9)-N1)-methyltransferase n=1 Tax=Chytriomyces confervae TaxID=246404 RepID=A0A507FIZ9_9FUNG|nr:tRNA methyltransferase 10 [Chytriomyces hyalinus]TPX76192.1 hypothetical protein CcCBS67573_g02542 [Chytriomyces confervae]